MLDFTVTINGQNLEGWKSAEVTRSIDSLSGSFTLNFTDAWNRTGQIWSIRPQDEIQISLGSNRVLTGYVDRVGANIGAESRNISAVGRDRTSDLIDSSVVGPFEYEDITFNNLAVTLAQQAGVNVVSKKKSSKPLSVGISPGDTVYSVLLAEARKEGLLMNTDGLGNLVIDEISRLQIPSALREGVNIENAQLNLDFSNRFNQYIVLAQSKGSDDIFGANASQIKGTAQDKTIRNSRAMSIIAEKNADQRQAIEIARYEANARAANSETVTVTIPTWNTTDSNGSPNENEIWPLNRLIFVDCPSINVRKSLLISSTTFSISAQGQSCTLGLRRPDAFQPAPNIPESDSTASFLESLGL